MTNSDRRLAAHYLPWLGACVLVFLVLATVACSDNSTPEASSISSVTKPAARQEPAPTKTPPPAKQPEQRPASGADEPAQGGADPTDPGSENDTGPENERSESQVLFDAADGHPFQHEPMPIDDARVKSKGIRQIQGRHLTLYTDLPVDPVVDDLPEVFDRAVPIWCEYFRVEPEKVATWKMSAFLIHEKERFDAAGLFPPDLPPFLHGYHRGFEFWIYDQPSDYYVRHLILHEGTHAFMRFWLGGTGPAWYSEGVAELLGTHRWAEGKLTMRYMPSDTDEVPLWGRIRLVRDDYLARKALRLDQLLNLQPAAYLENPPYGWSWAAATFLDNHPEYRPAFREAFRDVRKSQRQFNGSLIAKLTDKLRQLNEQWELFIDELDYGYDVARSAVLYRPGEPLPDEGATVIIRADRGWQSTGILVESQKTYKITASGRFQLDDQPKTWWCEPNGVTIHYYRGRPLGMLIGAIRLDKQPAGELPGLARSGAIGATRELRPQQSGTLYLRINDSPTDLANNAGTVSVRVEAE